MKILLVGATGTIGRAIAEALAPRHEVIAATRHSDTARVDIMSPESIRGVFSTLGPIDGIVCASGAGRYKPLAQLDDDDFAFSLQNKLMGQVNLIREGLQRLNDGGVIVVTTGLLARHPAPGSSALTMVNAGLEAFVRAAALEAPRGIRVNAVSPPWVAETLTRLGRDPQGGLPAATVARAYVGLVEGSSNGEVVELSV